MGVNKVIYGNDTLIDLTSDTVSANNLLSGETAHDRSGTIIQGSVTVPDELNDLNDVNISTPLVTKHALLYNRDSSKWENKAITTSDVSGLNNSLSNKTSLEHYHLLTIEEDDDSNPSITTDLKPETYYTVKLWNSSESSSESPIVQFDIKTPQRDYDWAYYLKVKNLNTYPYYETSHTEGGIAWTDNKDGTITANNTSTGNSSFICHRRTTGGSYPLIIKNGKYILSGCPSGGSESSYRVIAYVTKNGSASVLGIDYGEGVEIEVNGDDNYSDRALLQIGADIRGAGVVCNNLVFRPMLRLKSADMDSTWHRCAMTNDEITDILSDVPQTAGGYLLKATRASDGTISYSWVAE